MDLPEAAAALKATWVRFFETVTRPTSCTACEGERIWWDGSRLRSASVLADERVVHLTGIPCRRVKCALCKHRWTLRPPGLTGRRHYQLCVVAVAVSEYLFGEEKSLEEVAETHGCSRWTLRRWLRWVAELAEPAVLQQRILEVSGEPLRAPLRDVEALARKAGSAVRRRLLQAAARVMSLLEGLGMALRLEPPGLRGVVELVVADRDRVTTYARPLIPELARSASGASQALWLGDRRSLPTGRREGDPDRPLPLRGDRSPGGAGGLRPG